MKSKVGMDFPKHSQTVVVANFFGEEKNLEAWQLGWQAINSEETKSSVSEKIFNTYIETCHFNMIFYYVGDGNFYGIHGEECPRPVFRFRKEESKYPIYQIQSQDTHDYAEGDVLYNIPCDESVWDAVEIDGKPLEEVLQNSYIVNIS